jgi:dihydrofolate reductase
MEGKGAMSKITAFVNVTLDGVMQAPGRPDEDRRGDFQHGGWAAPYADEVLGRVAAEGMATTEGILLGRRTYQDFYGYWPKQTDNPFTDVLNSTQKYVASTTMTEPLPWANSTLLTSDVAQAVARLKQRQRKDIVILGSGALVRSLMRHDLIDAYTLLIHPLVLSSGRRLFTEGGPDAALRLVDTTTTTTGVIVATYQPAEATPGHTTGHVRVPVDQGESIRGPR